MNRSARQPLVLGLARRIWQAADAWLDHSALNGVWQRTKWHLTYRVRRRRIPSFEELLAQPHRQLLVDAVRGFAPIGSVLEIGCGRGANLLLLAQAMPDADIAGVDISAAAVGEARARLDERGARRVRVDCGRAGSLDRFSKGSVDVVLADAVLMYVPPKDIATVIAEMRRVARRGIVLGTWHRDLGEGEPALYDDGTWVYDYRALFKTYGDEIAVHPYPSGLWRDDRWARYGAIVEVRL